MKPAAILFDFDGTLIDSAPSILASYAAALEQTGLEAVVPLTPSLIGPPLLTTIGTVLGTDDEATRQRFAAVFREQYDLAGYRQTIAYEGVPALLEGLHEAGVRLFIVTNKRIAPTRRILEHLRWDHWFRGVYALDALQPPAPNKKTLVREVLQRESLRAADTWMVGDSREDQSSAEGNALRFFAAGWGYGQALGEGPHAPIDLLTLATA
ncbi:MAG: HAD family hydrolase [Sinobacteraceae bacterium]|nr:HAD family hydrolase [Nevskiaceae bacterium]